MKNVFELILDKNKRFLWLAYRGFYNKWPDKKYISRKFEATLGYPLNLDNPQTFNEKLQWLKLYDRKPIYTTMVDKYAVKDYVASIIGKEYIIPTLGVWDRFEDIDFDLLPNQFVLKCTHDSGGLIIVKDKSTFDLVAAQKKINKSLKRNYYYLGREWPYKDVKPRIIAEVYMEDTSTSKLRDFKFFCFNGMAKCCKVDFDRFIEHKANYFFKDGEIMRFGENICPPDFNNKIDIFVPLKNMEELASRLSERLPFLCTAFYDVNEKVYLGELIFFPASDFGKFIYDGNDKLFGSWLKIPETLGGGYILIYEDLLCVLSRASSTTRDGTSTSNDLAGHKIHSFNGVPKVILVCKDRFSEFGLTEDFFDYRWEHLDVKRDKYGNSFSLAPCPPELEKMLELSEKLSKAYPFLRTDFYTINGRVYFGEITFFSTGGFGQFVPESFDQELADWAVISTVGDRGILLRNDNCFVCLDLAESTNMNNVSAETSSLIDYKVYTFNGKAKFCMINQDRRIHTRADYFDKDFNWLDFTWGYDHADQIPEKPAKYELMFELAEKLAKGTFELRVDFYEVDGQVYFGELTFFDGSGFEKIDPIEWDYKLGSMIKLPNQI